MSEKPLRILIADDHAIVREGLEAILSAQPDLTLVGMAANGLEAVALAAELKPDVILIDLMMPKMDGLAAIQAIRAANPQACILVLTSFADDERVFKAIKAGALGYLLKDTLPHDLLKAIREVARGEVSLHPEIARRMLREIHQPAANPLDELTERERETLRLIAEGLSNQEIAQKMGIHENTVAKYVSALLGKLSLTSRTQAALYAVRSGVVKNPPNS
ncbi:MAG TPA: DNA-binding response regulator [Anaerolineaceae bacterium]|nr:DNA-binding response regulator [Anaerolineaceae bacterium]